jgi:rare lipoprotein A
LWQRVLAVFSTRPAPHHAGGTHGRDGHETLGHETLGHEPVQKAQAAPTTTLPVNAAAPAGPVAGALGPGDQAMPVMQAAPVAQATPVARAAAPVVQSVPVMPAGTTAAAEAASAPPAPQQIELASSAARPAKPPKKSRRTAAKAAPADAPVVAAVAEPPQERTIQDLISETKDAPVDSVPLAKPHAVAKVSKKTGHAKPDHAVDVAVLGAPNLKNVLPPESTGETAPPSEKPRLPAAQEQGAGCNGGQRIITAYYWEGHHTASGQPFDPHGMTAAHRTLPFGTRLNVTNPRTGKSVSVVINDRGPYVRGVSLDLSLGAAQAIGLHGTGSVCVL